MEFIKIPIDHLIKEPNTCSANDRYSHPAFTRKIPKYLMLSDFDKVEKLIEVEFKDGNRNWIPISEFFGLVIGTVKDILILYPDGDTESMSIVNIMESKVKRTLYWRLIFERDLPF
jgi:hypothetical protein